MSPQRIRAVTALALTGALAFGGSACGDDEPDRPSRPRAATPTGGPADIGGGQTALRLNRQLEGLLGVAGVEIRPVGAATRTRGALSFPIDRGRLDVDPPSGRLEHRGGLRFSVAGADIKATKLVLDARSGDITAQVAGRRVDLMTVDLAGPRMPQTGDVLVLTGSAGLSPDAAAVVNDRVGIEVLRGGLPLGSVRVDARRR